MAIIIPFLDKLRHSDITDGEREVAKVLQEKLSSDVIAWFNPQIPPKNLEPDFLVLDPGRGLLILEVKDWKIDTIQDADDYSVALLVNGRTSKTTNPLKQCKSYAYAITNQTKELTNLVNPIGHSYEGKLIFSYGIIIVLTNITRAELQANNLETVLGSESVFCKDEIFGNSDSGIFSEQLWSVLRFPLRNRLEQIQIDRFIQQLGLKSAQTAPQEASQDDLHMQSSPKPILKNQPEPEEANNRPILKNKENSDRNIESPSPKPILKNQPEPEEVNNKPILKSPVVEAAEEVTSEVTSSQKPILKNQSELDEVSNKPILKSPVVEPSEELAPDISHKPILKDQPEEANDRPVIKSPVAEAPKKVRIEVTPSPQPIPDRFEPEEVEANRVIDIAPSITTLNGRYLIEEKLGEGGFSIAFRARDLNLPGKPICVVKQLKNQDYSISRKVKKLFEKEAKSLMNLGDYPQIPRLLASFEENQKLYLVQEHIPGSTLHEEFFHDSPLPEDKVITILLELLQILDFIHGNKVIHRDVNPSNIIRNEQDSKLVLIDFGAVKEITTTGQPSNTIIGTPGYIAPEQSFGKPKYSSDIYAVGIIGIEAITGYHSDQIAEDTKAEWQKCDRISNGLIKILQKMTYAEQKKRYQSAKEVIAEIKRLEPKKTILVTDVASTGIQTEEIEITKPHKLPKPRNKLLPYVGAGVAASFLLLGVKLLQLSAKGTKTIPEDTLIEGVLNEKNNCQQDLINNIFCEKYTFKGKSGQVVAIEMNSSEFDPYLILQSPDGISLKVSEDIAPNNWNSEIVYSLPRDGEYTAIARTSSIGESGNYTLKINTK